MQSTPVNAYEAIVTSVEGSEDYRPSLFDLLSHNALEFYKTTENSITQPAYKFELTDDSYFLPAKEFAIQRITSQDSTSLQLLALHTFQNLLRFHTLNNNELATAAVDIERLQYVKEYGRFPEKEAKYLDALTLAKENTSNAYAKGMYQLEIAMHYSDLGRSYLPKTNETHRWKNKEALAICNELIEAFPDSIVASQANSLKQIILEPYLTITAEKYLPSNSPSRLLVEYKNHDTLSLTVYAISREKQKSLNKIYDRKNAWIL